MQHTVCNSLPPFQFFAFLALLAYGLDCYLKFMAWKNNEKAMGGRGFVRSPQTV